MTNTNTTPEIFCRLISRGLIEAESISSTADGFFVGNRSVSSILAKEGITDFPDDNGDRLACDRFFDDWHIYAVPCDSEDYVYGLLKLREQEFDLCDGLPADGDTPGVTVSFIAFRHEILFDCLNSPTDENRVKLSDEINRVVALRGQTHHRSIKKYFIDPHSEGAYLIAQLYAKHITSFAKDSLVTVPEHYKKLADSAASLKKAGKKARVPSFVDSLNKTAKRTVCDHKNIYLEDPDDLTEYELNAILATHTGNTSVYSFAAEIQYHAKFLTRPARIRLPFLGRSVYASAIRADMTIDDSEFEGPAPFYRDNSSIVKKQRSIHENNVKGKYF